MHRLLVVALTVLLAGCGSILYEKKTDLSYDPQNVPYGVFDWYRPIDRYGQPLSGSQNGLPCVIYIHGGAWMGGSKREARALAEKICRKGYTVVAPDYRLTADKPMPNGQIARGAPWPAQFEDLKRFLTYLKANAGVFGINPEKIASVGVSAGGHLAQMLHLRDPQIRTVTGCDLDGETDLTQPGDEVMADFDNIMTRAMGHPKPWTQAELTDISTIPLVTKDSKLFILHGEYDDNIYVKQADLLAARCQAVGCEYDYVRLPGTRGMCHGNCLEDDEAFARFIAWLDKYLK